MVELSIIVPARNEADNVGPLVEQVEAALVRRGIATELIVVDDGSDDATADRLRDLANHHHWLVALRRPTAQGQSAALHAGIAIARGEFIATLDADLQNDPADLPILLDLVRRESIDMAQGYRAKRKDNAVRKVTSWVGRTARRLILGDPIRDTGCATRVMRAEFAKRIPLQWKGMHRFIPVYARMLGARIVEAPVNHRPRIAGKAKYGVLDRGLVGLFDCFAMRWMLNRYRATDVEPIAGVAVEPFTLRKAS